MNKTVNNLSLSFRSKNLDILFKRDYYEQRLAIQRLNSEQLAEKEAAEAEEGGVETEEVGEFCFVFELAKTKTKTKTQAQENIGGEEEEGGEMAATAVAPPPAQILRQGKSFDQMDPR